MIGAFQHGRLHQQAARLLPALHRLLHQRRGLHGALVAVDMRIGAIAHQRIGVARPSWAWRWRAGRAWRRSARRARRRRAAASSSAPSASSSVSVTIAPCSDRQMPSSLPAFFAAPTIMSRIVSQRSLRELARRRGVGRRRPRPAASRTSGHRIDIAADLVPRAVEARHHRLALDQPALAVVVERGRQFREGVGLVHELRDQDAVRHRLTPRASPSSATPPGPPRPRRRSSRGSGRPSCSSRWSA